MTYTDKRLELFSEEELIIEVMEDYISVIEDTHTGFLNDKVSRRRECFDKLKLFIAESIHQALAEERERVRGEIAGIDTGFETGFNLGARQMKEFILSSLSLEKKCPSGQHIWYNGKEPKCNCFLTLTVKE